MCGLVGFQSTKDLPFSILLDNWKRGRYSLGWISPLDNSIGKHLLEENPELFIKNLYNSGKPLMMQFRQPTSTGRMEWVDKENYPLESESYYLFGNGIINASFYKSIKDEDNNNDLYYICKGIEKEGFDFLKKVEGCFSLVVIKKSTKQVFLIRKDYPLFISDKAYSSVKFEGSKLIPHGMLFEWNKGFIKDLQLESVYA